MALDFPASGQALWSLYDQGGPRPEYLLPVLFAESGFRPDIQNQAGYPYYGLNQISGSRLSAMGIDPTDYLTWPASEQISRVVSKYFLSEPGPFRSATRLEQANFLPATLDKARSLSSVLSTQGDPYYSANSGFDAAHKGYITVADLADFMKRSASTLTVQNAIASTYALRPNETPREPVYGEDFGGGSVASPNQIWIVASGVLAVSLTASWALRRGYIRI